MITPDEAETLARAKVEEYVNACHCGNVADVGNALSKLLLVTGQAVMATQGQGAAIGTLEAAARYLAKPEYSMPWQLTMHKLQ